MPLFFFPLAIRQSSVGRRWGGTTPLDLLDIEDQGLSCSQPGPKLGYTCDTSSNKEMVPLVGDPSNWPNLESQVPGRDSQLTPTQSCHHFLP